MESLPSYVKNSFDLKILLSTVVLNPGDFLVSFDVKAMYPSVPREESISEAGKHLEWDRKLKDRSPWKPKQITKLIDLCFETHFIFINGKVYTQYDGTPIGKSISGPICDLFMGGLESKHI